MLVQLFGSAVFGVDAQKITLEVNINKGIGYHLVGLLYECNPIAFIVEQAGGRAISMDQRIMEIEPEDLHQRSSFFCGNKEMIEVLEEHLSSDG